MNDEITYHPVYHVLNRRLTIMGLEQRLFFAIVMLGTVTFAAMGTLLGGILVTLSMYVLAKVCTRRDPQYFEILARASSLPREYDPIKFAPTAVVIIRQEAR